MTRWLAIHRPKLKLSAFAQLKCTACPGFISSCASLASRGASSVEAGLLTINCMSRLKNSGVLSAFICATGGKLGSVLTCQTGLASLFKSVLVDRLSVGCGHFVSRRRFCNSCTVAKSAAPLVCVLPMSQTMSVGDFKSVMPLGTWPSHWGPTSK